MPKKKSHKTYQSRTSSFLRRPIVQIGILGMVAVVIVLLIVTANPGGSNKSAALPLEISVSEAYSMYQSGEYYFVDVREPSEWDEYHAPNTTLIPLGELASRVSEIPAGVPIVVVCRSGNRSQQGRDILLQAGFTQVTSMAGGLNEWRSAGYPIEP
jgi:rhodanese-related sulfurtransferase